MKKCKTCDIAIPKHRNYCSRKCYGISVSLRSKGVPKPWFVGDKNPNYNGKYSSKPEVKEKFLRAVKLRGQPWTEQHRKQHSERMLGDSNAMRGKSHTEEFKENMSALKKQQYADGIVKCNLRKISKPEKEIAKYLDDMGIEYHQQYHIDQISYWYDFYLPEYNLILEFQGNYWHANPKYYPSGTILRVLGTGETLVDDIWERDRLKRDAAIGSGYKFVAIWESDYKEIGLEVIDKCLKR